jgi:predicted acyltransferase
MEPESPHGFTFYDLIQPLFLFITGITLPLPVGRCLARGQTRWEVFRHLLTRAVVLVILGHLDKNGAISFDVPHIRFSRPSGTPWQP